MRRLLAAVLVIASGVCLYFALTRPVVISQMVSLNQIIRVIYPEGAFVPPSAPGTPAAAPAAAAPDPTTAPIAAPPAPAPAPAAQSHDLYEKAIQNYEKLFTSLVLKTDAQKANFVELTKPKGYTAWQSAHVLYDAGDVLSGTAIIGFSIVYPILKTAILLVLIAMNVKAAGALKLAEFTHKYTMLDVFVAAVTVVSVSTQKLLVIDTGPAIWWYVGYLVLGFAGVAVLIWWPKEQSSQTAA